MAKANNQSTKKDLHPTKTIDTANSREISITPDITVHYKKGRGNINLSCDVDKAFTATLLVIIKGDHFEVTMPGTPIQKMANDCYQLFYQKNQPLQVTAGGNWEFFELKMRDAFLLKQIPSGGAALNTFTKNLSKKIPATISVYPLYAQWLVKDLCFSLLSEKFNNPVLCESFLRLKVQEILLYVFNEVESGKSLQTYPTAKEIKLGSKAKQLLLAYKSHDSFTNITLAEALGTNETTLKYAFKRVHGMTIYQFFIFHQMEKARALLQGGKSVREVSEIIGYKSIGHFSYAYKKYFDRLASNDKMVK